MKKNKYLLNLRTVLFTFFWGILMLGKGMGLKGSATEMRILTGIALVFVVIKICMLRYRQEEIIRMIFLNLLGMLVYFFSGEETVLLLCVTLTAMKGISYQYALKITFWIFGLLFFVRASLAMLGVLDSQMGYYYDMGVVPRVRYSLGYDHPNTAHFVLFIATAALIILYHTRLRIYNYILLFGFNIWVYQFTRSRSGVIMVTLLLIGSTVLNCSRGGVLERFLWIIANKSFILTTFVSLLCVFLYIRWDKLRSLGTFSSRFKTAVQVVQQFTLHPFGSRGVVTDLGIIEFLYSDGYIFFLLLIFGYYFLLRKEIFKKEPYFLLTVCCYAVYCLTENYADSVLMNITLLPFSLLLFDEKSENSFTLRS